MLLKLESLLYNELMFAVTEFVNALNHSSKLTAVTSLEHFTALVLSVCFPAVKTENHGSENIPGHRPIGNQQHLISLV
jgi:hypothetical protein